MRFRTLLSIATRLAVALCFALVAQACAPELGNPWRLFPPDMPEQDGSAPDGPFGLRRDQGAVATDDAADASVADAEEAQPDVAPQPDAPAVDAGESDDSPPPQDVQLVADSGDDAADSDTTPDAGPPPADVPTDAGAPTTDRPDAPPQPDVPAAPQDVPTATDAPTVPDSSPADVPPPDSSTSCVPPRSACGGSCVDPMSDALHCGGCGRACGAGEACLFGACMGARCGASDEWYLCGGACVSIASDGHNCGQCGLRCASGDVCRAGICVR